MHLNKLPKDVRELIIECFKETGYMDVYKKDAQLYLFVILSTLVQQKELLIKYRKKVDFVIKELDKTRQED